MNRHIAKVSKCFLLTYAPFQAVQKHLPHKPRVFQASPII